MSVALGVPLSPGRDGQRALVCTDVDSEMSWREV